MDAALAVAQLMTNYEFSAFSEEEHGKSHQYLKVGEV